MKISEWKFVVLHWPNNKHLLKKLIFFPVFMSEIGIPVLLHPCSSAVHKIKNGVGHKFDSHVFKVIPPLNCLIVRFLSTRRRNQRNKLSLPLSPQKTWRMSDPGALGWRRSISWAIEYQTNVIKVEAAMATSKNFSVFIAIFSLNCELSIDRQFAVGKMVIIVLREKV